MPRGILALALVIATTSVCNATTIPNARIPVRSPTDPRRFPQAPTRLDDGLYTISTKMSGKFLEPAYAGTNDGASVVAYKANNMRWQQWWLAHLGNGYYRVLNAYTHKAMDVYGYSYANGGNVAQWRWTGVANQQWYIMRRGSYYMLLNRHSGKALDLHGGSLVDGANIAQWEAYGGDTQLFTITKTW